MFRSMIAFLLAPFPAAIFQAIIVTAWPKEGMGVFEHPASMFAAICLLYYILGALLGLPLLRFFKKRRLPTLRGYALGGMVIALSPIVVLLGIVAMRGQLSAYIAGYNLAFFAFGGGTVFYLIKRPQRQIEATSAAT